MKSTAWPLPSGKESIRNTSLSFGQFAMLWLVALAPRLILALVFYSYPIALDDMFQYDMLARSIDRGDGYRWYAPADIETLKPYLSQFLDIPKLNTPPQGLETTFRPPGYPFFLAVLYKLVPMEDRFGFARLVQAVLLALMAPAVALLALKIGAQRKTAILAGIAMALYPIFWFYPIGLATENLFIPLLLAGVLALLELREKPGIGRAVVVGLILGLAMLTRSVVAPFVLVGGAWLWYFTNKRWRYALCMVVVAFGVCLPWSIRNSILMGKPSFVESSLGYQAYIGYHPDGNGGFISAIAIPPLTILDDAERDRYCSALVVKFIQADPLGALQRIIRRGAFFFAVEDRELTYFYGNNFFGNIPQPWLLLLYLAIILPWLGVLFLSPPGLRLSSNRAAAWLILGLIITYTAAHLLIIAEPRFHLALVPVLIPFAVTALTQHKDTLDLIFKGKSFTGWMLRLSLVILIVLVIWGFAMHWDRILAVMGTEGNKARLYY